MYPMLSVRSNKRCKNVFLAHSGFYFKLLDYFSEYDKTLRTRLGGCAS